ncbi:YebG family protein [Alteromonas oceanisediminis]|uniref:YebG family protein n=1 Tax=Alteromonas oceanisediminis TaxID=2836180 RepID=UPI001BDB25C9|nr:YebG family protein [Alteromonas oceanisediminis]MBT0587841.1 YebG family protein [Alteromonas oceanisediminis]
MAITVQYVVTHKGVEKLVTADKKAADQYDKMLDVADNLQHYLVSKGAELSEADLESLVLTLAQNKDSIGKILKGTEADKLLSAESAEVVKIKASK